MNARLREPGNEGKVKGKVMASTPIGEGRDSVVYRRPAHRGANGCTVEFAKDFVQKRLAGFDKDMKICLTGVARQDDPNIETHAYFPALMSCCSTLEYLAQLYLGKPDKSLGHDKIARYAERHLGKGYEAEIVRVLFEAFRERIAHRGIATGVWRDRTNGRRVVWKIEEDDRAPSIEVVEEVGELCTDAPWITPYSHRVYIHLACLGRDICASGQKYRAELERSPELQKNFCACMRHLYPV